MVHVHVATIYQTPKRYKTYNPGVGISSLQNSCRSEDNPTVLGLLCGAQPPIFEAEDYETMFLGRQQESRFGACKTDSTVFRYLEKCLEWMAEFRDVFEGSGFLNVQADLSGLIWKPSDSIKSVQTLYTLKLHQP